MGRPPRIQFEGACYHLFSRGNRRERIFQDESDYLAFEDMLLETMRWSGVLLYNWSQMPNHFHFNVETPDGNLAEFMQRLLARYAKHFNRTHRLVGHVFQGRYGSVICEREARFEEIVRYVELNPYRLKGGRMLAPLGQWRWSSLYYLLQPEEAWPEGCATAFRRVLAAFSQDPERSRKRLLSFLADGLESKTWEDFYQVKAARFLGSEAFVERVKAQMEEPVRLSPRDLRRLKKPDDLLEVVARTFGVSRLALGQPDQDRSLGRLRQIMAYVGRRHYRMSVQRLGGTMGRSGAAVSMMLRRTKHNVDKWPETNRLLEALTLPGQIDLKC